MNHLPSKTTEELLQLLKEGTNLHSEGTIMDIEVILQERDVQYNVPYKKAKRRYEPEVEAPKSTEDSGLIFTPFLLAIVFMALPYLSRFDILLPASVNPDQLFYINIGIVIILRIMVLAVIDHFNSKLGISGSLWYLLGLVFGPLALIAYNIYLWVRPSGSSNDQILDSTGED